MKAIITHPKFELRYHTDEDYTYWFQESGDNDEIFTALEIDKYAYCYDFYVPTNCEGMCWPEIDEDEVPEEERPKLLFQAMTNFVNYGCEVTIIAEDGQCIYPLLKGLEKFFEL